MFEKMCAAAGAAAGEECPGKELWWFGGDEAPRRWKPNVNVATEA